MCMGQIDIAILNSPKFHNSFGIYAKSTVAPWEQSIIHFQFSCPRDML